MEYQKVTSRKELLDLIFQMLDENDAVKWDNDTACSFLQAMAGWLNDSDGFYKNMNIDVDTDRASWQLFADALQAATIYE